MRKELKRLVENNPKWDRKVCGLQVTDTKENTIEIRALVSAANPGKTFDLRCEVREGLIEFLRRQYPESLPRLRISNEPSTGKSHPGEDDGAATSGKEHERGPTTPGVHADAKAGEFVR